MKKATLPSRSVIFEAWKTTLDRVFLIDWGEPCCWACNRPISYRESHSIAQRWDNATGLERHHIVAESLGGSADPSNLFLLCRPCHDKAPTTTDKEMLIRWAKKQNYLRDELDEFNEALEAMLPDGVSSDDLIAWADAKGSAGIHEIFHEETFGVHLSPLGPRIPRSGFAAVLAKRYKKEVLNEE